MAPPFHPSRILRGPLNRAHIASPPEFWEEIAKARPPEPDLACEARNLETLSMTQEIDEFDEMEALLSSAQRHANKMREHAALRRTARTQRELSEDYAERLAEKATFRRLLSDEALDGVRFRFLFEQGMKEMYEQWRTSPSFRVHFGLDYFRKWLDEQIAGKEGINGPSA